MTESVRIRDIENEKARRRAARQMIGEYHEQQLRLLLDHVRDGFVEVGRRRDRPVRARRPDPSLQAIRPEAVVVLWLWGRRLGACGVAARVGARARRAGDGLVGGRSSAPARRLNARNLDRPATGRSCGASARVCGRGVLSRRRPRRALHHGPATASDRGEDATPDRRDPPPLARSRPQDGLCGTSALGRVPPRPPLPLTGSGGQTRSRPDPDRGRRPLRAHLGRWSPPGKGIAPDGLSEELATVSGS